MFAEGYVTTSICTLLVHKDTCLHVQLYTYLYMAVSFVHLECLLLSGSSFLAPPMHPV